MLNGNGSICTQCNLLVAFLLEIKLVENVWRVLCAFTGSVHLARVITLDTALLITAKRIPGEIRVLVLEVLLCTVSLLR